MKKYYIYESISAWFHAPAEEQSRHSVDLESYVIEHPNTSVLVRVKWESMIQAGIHPQDVVIVDKSKTPRHGDVVVAAIDGSYTIKYFYKDIEWKIYLQAGDTHQTIVFPEESLELFGVVVSLLRKF